MLIYLHHSPLHYIFYRSLKWSFVNWILRANNHLPKK
nr:MAG TPA: hypothetical protein [Caudoviricetes sp.]